MHNILPWRYIGALSIAFVLVVGLLLVGFSSLAGHYLRLRNPSRRIALLDELAKSVGGGSAERLSLERKRLVGFFHPYWYVGVSQCWLRSCSFIDKFVSNAAGGGERVLWCAISYLQENEPDVIAIVYTGDVDASKEQIVSKVHVCPCAHEPLNGHEPLIPLLHRSALV